MKPKTQHTPGPWKVLNTPTRKETFWAICTASEAPVQALICLVDGKSKAHQEKPEMAEANARLIAAAPALLEACKAALKCQLDGLDENTVDDLEAAIRQVEGE